MNVLYCYSQEKAWIPVDMEDTTFSEQYKLIKGYLDKFEGKGVLGLKNETFPQNIKIQNIDLSILSIESHRLCTVIYVLQMNHLTNGLRYLVYGTKFNLDSTYGIGTTLETVDVDKYCPNNRNDFAKFL